VAAAAAYMLLIRDSGSESPKTTAEVQKLFNDSGAGSNAGISWRCLAIDESGKRALMIADNIIDWRAYNDDAGDITWAGCTLRKWFNGEFLSKGFSEAQRAMIAETRLDNPDNTAYGIAGGEQTTDKVFLLSIDEANKYFASDYERIATVKWYVDSEIPGYSADNPPSWWDESWDEFTDYSGKANWWWLRSPANSSSRAARVQVDGRVDASTSAAAHSHAGGLRPALWIDL